MLVYKIIGIILAVVVVGGVLIWYAIKQNILNINNWFTKKIKTHDNDIIEIKKIVNYFNGPNNINSYKKLNDKEILITLKQSLKDNTILDTVLCKTKKLNSREYILEFIKGDETINAFRKMSIILR